MSEKPLKVDSPIWTNPASDFDPFIDLVMPDNLDEIIKQAHEQSKAELEERCCKFRVKVRYETLLELVR